MSEITEYTRDEVKARFIKHVNGVLQYWSCDKDEPTQVRGKRDALEGMIFSILATIDGCSMNIPGFLVIPFPKEGERDYHIQSGENFFPETPYPEGACDIAGDLYWTNNGAIHLPSIRDTKNGQRARLGEHLACDASEQPTQYTESEVRAKFLCHIWHLIKKADALFKETIPAMQWLRDHLFIALDCGTCSIPPFLLIPYPHPDDRQFCIDNGERYFPQSPLDPDTVCDIGGGLHELFHRYEKEQ